jgi:adenylosuccinate lyase
MELTHGLMFSQRLMLALVEKGMSRDGAYKIAQNNSSRVWEEEADFRELIRSDGDVAELLDSTDLDGIFDYAYYVRYVDHTFERVGLG